MVLSDRVIELLPESMTMLPVESPPMFRVFIRRDCIVAVEAVRDRPLPNPAPRVAEIVAVGNGLTVTFVADELAEHPLTFVTVTE